jgi:hypothetical protein
MLRAVTYIIALLKLLGIGRWYPPAHVRDVSQAAFLELVLAVQEMGKRLEACERQTEATRKKVYRDEEKATSEAEIKELVGEKPPTSHPEPQTVGALGFLHAGDEVPEGFL